MRGRLWLIGVLVLLAAGAGVMMWRSRSGSGLEKGDISRSDPETQAQPALGMRLEAVAGGGASPLTVRLFNASMRQRAAIRSAQPDGSWKGTIANGVDRPIVVPVARDAWPRAVAFEVLADDGTASPLTGASVAAVTPASDSVTLGAAEVLRVDFALAAASMPPPGTRLRASFASGSLRATSNTVTMPPQPAAPAALVRDARLAVTRKDFAEAERIARSLIQASPERPHGHYYLGLALEGRGDTPGALAAYEAALARVTGTVEPPTGLISRITRLRRR